MVGLNVEMGARAALARLSHRPAQHVLRPVLGRRRGEGAAADIDPISGWHDAPLGDAAGAPVREQFVLLMRSALLRRYPNAIIYAAPAIASGGRARRSRSAHERFPAFRGEMKPDVSFFGFDITPAAAVGSDGDRRLLHRDPGAPDRAALRARRGHARWAAARTCALPTVRRRACRSKASRGAATPRTSPA